MAMSVDEAKSRLRAATEKFAAGTIGGSLLGVAAGAATYYAQEMGAKYLPAAVRNASPYAVPVATAVIGAGIATMVSPAIGHAVVAASGYSAALTWRAANPAREAKGLYDAGDPLTSAYEQGARAALIAAANTPAMYGAGAMTDYEAGALSDAGCFPACL